MNQQVFWFESLNNTIKSIFPNTLPTLILQQQVRVFFCDSLNGSFWVNFINIVAIKRRIKNFPKLPSVQVGFAAQYISG